MPEFRQRIIQKKAREAGIGGYWGVRDMDPSYVIWHLGQLDRNRIVEEVNTRSCHALWISYRNEEAKAAALAANRFVNVEGERIHETA